MWFISVTFCYMKLCMVGFGFISLSYFTYGSFQLCFFSSFLSLRFVMLGCVWFGFVSFSYVMFGSVSLHHIMSPAPTGMLKYFPISPHMPHLPESSSLTNISHRCPSYPFNPVPTHNISACGVCIYTGKVLFSFVVICVPQVDKITI
jgi:hypothetical protein